MGMNRHTEIKKNRILKTSMESYDNKRRNCTKYITLSICVKKLFFYELIFALLSQIWRILSNFYENHQK